ncbi:MAG: tetratricopeptide repeat protein [Salibacteraceae bacterium]
MKKIDLLIDTFKEEAFRSPNMSEKGISFSIAGKAISWTLYQTIFYGLLALMLAVIIPISWNSGISGDEEIQYNYGKAIVNWFMNFGEITPENEMVMDGTNVIHAYSSSFDFFTAAFNELFGIEKEYEVRHVFNGISGWLLILFTGLVAQQVMGWRAAVITIFILFFSPRLLGHAWNNPKDIPFAFTYIFGFYFILKYTFNIRNMTWKLQLLTALAIGSSIGIRIGGLILVGYLFLFVGLYYLFTSGGLKNAFNKEGMGHIKNIVISTIVVALGAYVIGIMFWPYALDNPIENPMKALGEMSDFASKAGIRQLYKGDIVWSDHLPPYYTLHYIFMTTPVAVMLGVLLFFAFLRKKVNSNTLFWKFALFFAFAFPIFYIFYKDSMVYSGWRHTLFTYPTLAVCAAIGFEFLIRQFKNGKVQVALLCAIPVLLIHPISHTIKNSPFQYIYFNEIIGGVDNTVGEYENDYYYHSSKEAYDWLLQNVDLSEYGNGKKLKVATNDFWSLRYFTRNDTANVVALYKRYYERGNSDWDYYICVNNYINPGQLKRDLWPPANTVYEVKVDNTVIGVVLERKTRKDFEGYDALQSKDLNAAIPALGQAIQEDPNVECAYLNLAEAYMQAGMYDEGVGAIQSLLKVYPKYDKAYYTQSIILLNQGKLKESIESAKTTLKINPKFDNAYYIIAVAYMQAGDANSALKNIQLCLQGMPNFKPGYLMLSQILQQQGKTKEAEYYQNIANQL